MSMGMGLRMVWYNNTLSILNMQASTKLRYNEYNRKLRTENSETQYTNERPQRARAQRPRGDAREYRARALNQRGG